ncbi:MAG: hypothetical protein LBT01_04835 [Spirochaetaceae bacterium]|jgi:hypothetical protein|nr:hypothetical protein [Spirochaetaceae bacterium]
MRNVTKLLLLVCTALTALAFAACEVIASTAGQDLPSETVWISLTPTVPEADGNGVRTATLTLDFSRAIDGLTSETSAEDLEKIFTFAFDPPDGAADFKMTRVEKIAVAVYRLSVVNVPLSGSARVTVNRPDVTPTSRLWSLDGRVIEDKAPEITGFVFTQSENSSLSEPETVGSIDQTTGKIVVVAPEGTSLNNLIPTVSTSAGSDFSPKGAQDFSNPIQYTVQSATTGALRDYEVRVIEQKSNSASIEMFQFLAEDNTPNLTKDVSGIITGSSIALTVPYGTALGALIPAITY